MWDLITNAELWKAIGGLGGTGAAIFVLGLLVKTWIGNRIKRDVEDTYKAKQQQRKAEFDQSLEKRKTELCTNWKDGRRVTKRLSTRTESVSPNCTRIVRK